MPFMVEEVRTVNIRTEPFKAGGFILNCTQNTWYSLRRADRWCRILRLNIVYMVRVGIIIH